MSRDIWGKDWVFCLLEHEKKLCMCFMGVSVSYRFLICFDFLLRHSCLPSFPSGPARGVSAFGMSVSSIEGEKKYPGFSYQSYCSLQVEVID